MLSDSMGDKYHFETSLIAFAMVSFCEQGFLRASHTKRPSRSYLLTCHLTFASPGFPLFKVGWRCVCLGTLSVPRPRQGKIILS